MSGLYTAALWITARLLEILIAMQKWFDHQNGYDQMPPDCKGPVCVVPGCQTCARRKMS